ncbi:FadR/GntR family transcriptional regulator [Sediminibacterium ginsengisoli]|uniref:Transcriptional regulator, GntR family n=1 Tax=Sediminibacterium ginsengisoli TaxID=413434 RepID=A0A1T4PAQ9_9BACT|nr:FadR/GntR family transcriptional regulator [Sediminibacterium ginsengisoli]SJZ88336.1 transcriptional regulator, GntR family [Sediminibacterium ginsengisoli]
MEIVNDVFENIKAIQIESPSDKIIRQLKQLITSGQLKPGDRLPSERLLSERFGVGRSYVREAIMKLEFYGLLKTSPQSGTYVAGYGIKILDSIISDIIKINKDDFGSLIEARYYMEMTSARLAAERRSEDDIRELKAAVNDYNEKIAQGQEGAEEDMLFHIKIAKATKNTAIESMVLILSPDIIRYKIETDVCKRDLETMAMKQHEDILDAIIRQDVKAAELAMATHLDKILRASKQQFMNNKDVLEF